jgi:Domain of Unknown Function (DUF1259)
MIRLIGTALVLSLSLAFAIGAQAPSPQPSKAPAGLDVAAIDRAMGKSGTIIGDVYKISLPRTDLNVTVGGLKVKAGFALGGWAAFKAAGNGTAGDIVHGDLVLLDSELNPVISGLQQHDFEITAIHNHLINETPALKYIHYWGHGEAATLAANLKDAISHSKMPVSAAPALAAASMPKDDLPADAIQQAIGLKGTVSNGVLSLSQPRPETIQMMGVTLPPSMGMATAINFQSAGPGKVAATGDFVMLADEVNKVARVLRQHDIAIAALHNHMLHGSPELFFMHFWAVGDAGKVSAGLKAALAEVKH